MQFFSFSDNKNLIENTSIDDKIMIEKYLIQIFDKYYISFIEKRKTKDIVLINKFFEYLFNQNLIKIDVNLKDKINSKVLTINNSIIINNDYLNQVIKPLNKDIEKILSIIKAVNLIYLDLENIFNDFDYNLEIKNSLFAKINKIADLNNSFFINFLLKDKKMIEKFNHFLSMDINFKDLNYEQIEINQNYYENLLRSIEKLNINNLEKLLYF